MDLTEFLHVNGRLAGFFGDALYAIDHSLSGADVGDVYLGHR